MKSTHKRAEHHHIGETHRWILNVSISLTIVQPRENTESHLRESLCEIRGVLQWEDIQWIIESRWFIRLLLRSHRWIIDWSSNISLSMHRSLVKPCVFRPITLRSLMFVCKEIERRIGGHSLHENAYPCRLRFSLSSISSEKLISPTPFRIRKAWIPMVSSAYSFFAMKSYPSSKPLITI